MAFDSSVIPRNAVELLFAEDLVNRIMRQHTGMKLRTWRAAPYRDFIYNAFNEDIGEAVDFIDMMLEWEVDESFSRLVDEHRVNRDAFINCALHFEELCFKQGFDADNFLNFCVRLVSMSAYFDQYGVPLALELALFFIVKVMTKYDLFEGGWDTLNAVAKKYMERKEDFYRTLTPDVSDDESLMNVQEDEAEDDFFNEDEDFAVNDEKEPKEESDRETMDSSGLNFESPTSSESMVEAYALNEDDDFPVNDGKEAKEESDRETMDSSGLNSELLTSSENIAEGNVFNEDDGFAVNNEKKPKDESDNQMVNLSGSKFDLCVSSEYEAEVYISNAYNESVITQQEKPRMKPEREARNLSGSKLDLPACPESVEKLETGVFLDI